MSAVFRYAFRRSRGQVIGWGLTLLLLALMMVSFYDSIAAEREEWQKLLEIYPKEMLAFFGDPQLDFTTAEGFLGVELFSFMPLVLGVYAILAGGGLLVDDEEDGRMDLILGQPISRRSLFFGRLLAFTGTTVIICLLGWLGIAMAMLWSTMDLSLWTIAKPYLSVLAMVMVFASLALLLSLILPSRKMAGMLTGVILAASFFLTGLSRLSPDLEKAADFSPLTYYQGGEAMNVLEVGWLVGLLGVSLIFILISWWRFERREIRVGGEGGWRLPFIRRRKPIEGSG